MSNQNINYISLRDIAEDARLNFEIEDELRKYKKQSSMSCSGLTQTSRSNKDSLATWIVGSSPIMTMIVCLTLFALLPNLALAETCTPTPDCKSLGYTETSCPDGSGVKCPWNTNLLFCGNKCAVCGVKSCQIGDVLYADKKCYACLPNALPEPIPIGVVFASGKAVGLVDLGKMTLANAQTACRDYKVGGVSGWHLPNKDELLAIYSSLYHVTQGFSSLDGKNFVSDWYWSSSIYAYSDYWFINPINGDKYWSHNKSETAYVRPVLNF